MGMYSWLCSGCGRPISSVHNPDVVAVLPWKRVNGKYDGYGNVVACGVEIGVCPFRRNEEPTQHASDIGQKPDIYHRHCWDGQDYRGGSLSDPNQGWGVDEYGEEEEEEE